MAPPNMAWSGGTSYSRRPASHLARPVLTLLAGCASGGTKPGRNAAPPGSILTLFGQFGLVDADYRPKPVLAVWDSVRVTPLVP